MRAASLVSCIVMACFLACGCGGKVTPGDGDPDGDTDAAVDSPGDGGIEIEEDGETWTCHITVCDGHLLECGDCEDNDEDGLVDSHDPECLGPCDNTEGPALTTGVGGETGGPCKADCYFDFGNGSGNDQCFWDHRCDPLAVAPDYPPEGVDCEYDPDMVGTRDCPDDQLEICLDYCMPITPNGCDCFGCCTLDELAGMGPDGGPGYVWIGAMDEFNEGTCTLDDILDPALCPPCTPVGDCWNECGECELCLGRTELPPECFDDRCPEGVQVCGLEGDEPCPPDYYCITGCCIPTLI